MTRTPELNPTWRAFLERFLQSDECAAAACGASPWILSFLDSLQLSDETLDDLDFPGLIATLYDSMGWTIPAAPDDPAVVARDLLALLRWALRTGEVQPSRRYDACCRYLASAEAVATIGRCLEPLTICWHDGRDPAWESCPCHDDDAR